MLSAINAINAASGLISQAKNFSTTSLAGVFDNLFNQLASAASGGSYSTGISAADTTDSSSTATTLVSPSNTPLSRLEQSLRDTGQSLDKFQVPKADRDKLEDTLVQSGYKREDAKQLIQRSSDSDGNVNLGTLFGQLPQFVPTQGPRLLLSQEDVPMFTQVLKDMGISAEQVQKYLDSLSKEGDKLVVTGLPELLAQAGNQGKSVDASTLSDLLGKLGLSQDQVQTLLSQGTDSQGQTNAQNLLAMFQAASNQQSLSSTQVLTDLANHLQILGTVSADANQVKAQVIQGLQKIEGQVQNQAKFWQQALEEAQAALKDQASGDLLKNASAGKTDGQTQAQGVEALLRASKSAEGSQSGAAAASVGQSAATGAGSAQGASGQAVTRAEAAANLTQAAQNLSQSGETGRSSSVVPSYVVRQVSQQMVQMVAKQQSSLSLDLKPPTLGELSIELTVKDGAIKATMVAESVAAKQSLEAGMDQLKQQLSMQGLKVDQITITVNPDAQRQAQAQAQSGFSQGRQGSGDGRSGSGLAGGGDALDSDTLARVVGGGAGGAESRVNVFA